MPKIRHQRKRTHALLRHRVSESLKTLSRIRGQHQICPLSGHGHGNIPTQSPGSACQDSGFPPKLSHHS